jgi:hypothetical protein
MNGGESLVGENEALKAKLQNMDALQLQHDQVASRTRITHTSHHPHITSPAHHFARTV